MRMLGTTASTVSMAQKLEAAGCSMLVLQAIGAEEHGAQRGVSDWDTIRAVKCVHEGVMCG